MRNLRKNKWYVIFPALLLFVMTSCDLFDTTKELTAEDAKMELRSAGNDIMYNFGAMMETPAMYSLSFLGELMDIEFDGLKSMNVGAADSKRKSTFIDFLGQKRIAGKTTLLPGVSKLMAIVGSLNPNKDLMTETHGVYNYNFATNEFDLATSGGTFLELNFPADEQAYQNQERNSRLRISNLQFTTVTYYDEDYDEYEEEEVPTSFNATQWIDQAEVMTASYNASLNELGLPLSVTLSVDMSPYSMSLTHNGSNRDYTTKASVKLNNTELLGIDMRLKYTSDMEEVEKADGSITVNPLRFKGDIHPYAISMCENIECMNNNINMEVIQTELNAKIGVLGFRMKDGYPELVIIYEDDSHEFLALIFEDMF